MRGQGTSDLDHPNWEQRRWVLPERLTRETEVDFFTSMKVRNKGITDKDQSVEEKRHRIRCRRRAM